MLEADVLRVMSMQSVTGSNHSRIVPMKFTQLFEDV
jgi:hypothetical protein